MYTLALSVMLSACGPKDAPQSATTEATDAAVAAAPVVEPEPEPEPEPVEPPPPVSNADFQVTITYASGASKSGHVIRIERSEDWYGDNGWTTDAASLKLSADGGSEYKKLLWSEISSVTVKAGSVPGDVDCFYDSDFSPWMYDCTLKTTGTITDTSGKHWTVDNRHKWRMTFEDGDEVEFWLKKHSARAQDEEVVDLETVNPENYELYTSLQQQLRTDLKGDLVVAIKVQ